MNTTSLQALKDALDNYRTEADSIKDAGGSDWEIFAAADRLAEAAAALIADRH